MEHLPTKSSVKMQKAEKRTQEEATDAECNPKKQKVDAIPLRLVDINDDCLQMIFEFLNLDDLVNVAEANESFIPAAVAVFSRFHRNKEFKASLFLKPELMIDDISLQEDAAAAFFRHFGHRLLQLSIHFYYQHSTTFEKMILQYCTDSLTKLHLYIPDGNNFNAIRKPFTMVEKLHMSHGLLGKQLSQISIWFPNLTTLELVSVNLFQLETIDLKLPRLKHLLIALTNLSQSTICKILRANQQLESLVLRCDYDVHLLQTISRHLPQLEELGLWPPTDGFQSFGDQKFCFDHLKKFTLCCLWRSIENISFTFTNLHELNLIGFDRFDEQISDFAKKFKSINKLSLASFYAVDDNNLLDKDLNSIVKSLPNLTELELSANLFTADYIVQFLFKCDGNLKTVRLLFNEPPKWYQFRAKIGTKWTMVVTEHLTEHENYDRCMYYDVIVDWTLNRII